MNDSTQFAKTNSSNRTSITRSPQRRRGISFSLAAAPALVILLLAAADAFGGSATWNLNPTSGFWESASNWTPATVPNGPADTATFDVSNTTDVFTNLGDDTEVNGILFNAGASAFTITVASQISFDLLLTISGVGVTNNSGIIQNFVTDAIGGVQDNGVIRFTNSSTAGDFTVFTNINGGRTEFSGMSSAGHGTFKNDVGTTFPSSAGRTDFFDNATADSAILIADGSGDAFKEGGTISFQGDSTGGTARVEVFALDGNLDISAHNPPGVTIGSIEGTGSIILGANNLTVGNNNLSTNFSGQIGGGGSLTKIGTGKLTLSGSNKYNGGTIVNDGTLLVNNKRRSGTGKRPVQVNAGTLGGTGTVGSAVTIGTGSGSGAFLSPGVDAASHRTLTIRNTLTFNSDGTYKCGFNSGTARADKVIAIGVTISSGAQFSFRDSQATTLPLGTVFTVVDNTAATPIAGTFINLAEGSTFTVGSNTFQASYEGGDGNDLTLTVMP